MLDTSHAAVKWTLCEKDCKCGFISRCTQGKLTMGWGGLTLLCSILNWLAGPWQKMRRLFLPCTGRRYLILHHCCATWIISPTLACGEEIMAIRSGGTPF